MEERPLGDPATHVDLSPEARRREAMLRASGLQGRIEQYVGPGSRFLAVIRRVWTGAYYDGFIHAGNLAYMSLLALFPFFIVVAAIFSALGEPAQQAASIRAILSAVPPMVAKVIEPVATDVITARSGWLLWVGAFVGLWTTGSLIETIRDILHRAYGTPATHAFWRYRLLSTGVIFAAVTLLLLSLFVQVSIVAAEEIVAAWFPQAERVFESLTFSRLVTALVLYSSLYLLFFSLTPARYNGPGCSRWPGALLVTVWWVTTTALLPAVLHRFFTYDLTYGSLAGVMIALFFFWLVGLGMVVGAELNAALAMSPEERDLRNQAIAKLREQAGSDTEGHE